MVMNPELTKSLQGLTADQITSVMAATKRRIAACQRQIQVSDETEWTHPDVVGRDFAIRCILDFAAELKAGRELEIGQTDRLSVVYERDYRPFYESPRGD